MTQTTHHSFTKKALSVLLTIVMLFGYVGMLSGLIGSDLFGTKQTAEAATSASNSLTFVVPEAIYLYPDGLSWRDSSSTPLYGCSGKPHSAQK